MAQTRIWWVRRDIRLQDNQALDAALQDAEGLVPLFILEPDLLQNAAPLRKNFLLQALSDLDQQLRALGSQLILRWGPADRALNSLVKELNGAQVFTHEDFSPYARQRDQVVVDSLGLRCCPGVVLRHPTAVLKNNGEPYTVFTPYKNRWYQQPLPTQAECLSTPQHLPPFPENIHSTIFPDFDPVEGFAATAEEALRRLTAFTTDEIQSYQSLRNRLDLDGTSQLSPYLRFGLISAREAFVQSQITLLQASTTDQRAEIQTWMDELVWREFYTAILYHFPHVINRPFRVDYQHIPWREAPEDLSAWQQGLTGYPVVDACMRQLLQTGWMHNRGRMIAASFLTKDLLINWQAGEAWFMKNLIDGDPAANNGGWQWTAGTGTDAAPYFRIFNPITQGEKYDPQGEYITRWVPELRHLPTPYRHQPWKLSGKEALLFNFKPGIDYPHQIVDHAFARQRTLAAYKSSRENTSHTGN